MSGFLVNYGAYNLSNNIIVTTEAPKESDVKRSITSQDNASSNGSTITKVRKATKSISVTGDVNEKTGVLSLEKVKDRLKFAVSDQNRFFRVLRSWVNLADITTTNGWSLSGDSINKYLESSEFQFDSSIGFDLDVSAGANDYGTIYSDSQVAVNLGRYKGIGNFEVFVYLPNSDYVTSVDIKIGTDQSNYWVGTITKQFDDDAISDGWNLFSIRWDNMAVVGTPDPYTIKFVSLSINYYPAKDDCSGVLLGGFIWEDDRETICRRCVGGDVSFGSGNAEISSTSFTIELENYTAVGESTQKLTQMVVNAVSNVSYSFDTNFEGTSDPSPVLRIVLHSVTNLDTIIFTNLTTNKSITLDEAWALNDIIEINTENAVVTRNNIQIDYTNVLPLFKIGRNRCSIVLTSTSQSTVSQTTQDSNLSGSI